jgi:hypothetical protein
MAELAVGNFVKFTSGDTTLFRFQNFFIGETITNDSEPYNFCPFGFSGVTVNRTGDGTEASIVLPNSTENVGVLTRRFSQDAINERWIAYVRVLIVDPDDKTSFSTLSNYYGQITNGSWDNASISLTLSSVLHAVGSEIPQRKLSQELVGNLPTTSSVRLQ